MGPGAWLIANLTGDATVLEAEAELAHFQPTEDILSDEKEKDALGFVPTAAMASTVV
jgi:hypothetical protein